VIFANVQSNERRRSPIPVHFHDQECDDLARLLGNKRLGAVTIHEIGEFVGIVSNAAGKTCFVDFKQRFKIFADRVPD